MHRSYVCILNEVQSGRLAWVADSLVKYVTKMLLQLGYLFRTFIEHIKELAVIATIVVVKERESNIESVKEVKCFRVYALNSW
jgi:hypothetical protein